jgi:hypothetical protein
MKPFSLPESLTINGVREAEFTPTKRGKACYTVRGNDDTGRYYMIVKILQAEDTRKETATREKKISRSEHGPVQAPSTFTVSEVQAMIAEAAREAIKAERAARSKAKREE